jgi:hypothetical protein
MTTEAMKQALEALTRIWEDGLENFPESGHDAAITALRTAIEQADEQEAWKTSDTAYRPDGLPQDFIKHEVDSFADWSEWVCPDPEQYFMKCCHCGLVHEMQFNVVKYSAGDECEDVDDPYVQAVFRARRHEVGEKQKDSLAQTNWDNIPQAFNDWYVLFQHCENEMRYAGWDKREADNNVRNDVYEQVKNLLEKNT